MNKYNDEKYWTKVARTFYNLYSDENAPDISQFTYEHDGEEKDLGLDSNINEEEFALVIESITEFLNGERDD